MNIPFASFLISEMAWSCFASMMLAQFLKPFCAFIQGKGWGWGRMLFTGGMPSSHTSLVTALTLGVAQLEGSGSAIFAMVLVFSIYFVFEATGLRQEVGQQAKVLNEILDELYQSHHLDSGRLKELVGHTWSEVLGGGVLGVVVFFLWRHRFLA